MWTTACWRHEDYFSVDELSLALDLVEIFDCGFDFSAHEFSCECSGNKSSTGIVQPGTAGSASAICTLLRHLTLRAWSIVVFTANLGSKHRRASAELHSRVWASIKRRVRAK